MSSLSKRIGKYVVINPKAPSALGQCDHSGFIFNHKDLVKQMQWAGNNLVWTGKLVGPPYVDELQEQDRPPLVKDDPRPVKNARIPDLYTDPESNPALPAAELLAKLQNFNWGT